MASRRNFLKKVGMGCLTGIIFKDISSKDFDKEIFLNDVYGLNFIKDILGEYKGKRPVKYAQNSWNQDLYSTILLKDINVRIFLDCPNFRPEYGFFENLLIEGDDCWYARTCISKNKKGFYLIEHPNQLLFDEEKEGLCSSIGEVMLPLLYGKEIFEPYKELHKLIWSDFKTNIS